MTAQTGKGQHTPGPWRVMPSATKDECPLGDGLYVQNNAGPVAFASSGNVADARLIAAAPTLLEILRALTEAVLHENGERIHVRLAEARAAIRLAEGSDE